MKKLDFVQMEQIEGGLDLCSGSGVAAGVAALTIGVGVATGGMGFVVVGAMASYTSMFGAIAGCAAGWG